MVFDLKKIDQYMFRKF